MIAFRWHLDIAVMDADGNNRVRLTDRGGFAPTWSPEGTRIAFDSFHDGNWEIYVMNPDGSNLINLTNHPARDGGPAWSPAPKGTVVSPKERLATTWGRIKEK